MWKRRDVKAKGKSSFQKCYWKAVLVALIVGIVGGGAAGGAGGYYGGFGGNSLSNRSETTKQVDLSDLDIDIDGVPNFDPSGLKDLDDIKDLAEDNDSSSGLVINGVPFTSSDLKNIDSYDELNDFLKDHGGKTLDEVHNELDKGAQGAIAAAVIIVMIVCFIIAAIVAVFSFIMTVFLFNPINFGCKRFFRKNLDDSAKLSNIFFAFKSNYKNVVKTGFFYTLFITLWTLLFVIPGIIKSYQYRLVPYIIGENPDMNWREALDESSRLMKGNKWKAFVYDLSFIGWELLSGLTLGIFGVFYVNPYKNSSDAALYEAIRYGSSAEPQVAAEA
ncbi:MAG: DUF975 family protein [Clostridiales bacterium]|nr:DUF975 family protein [Clostridiales bacterium]